ncbi:Uncharacterised protein [Serratia liquefaciens]|nr:Uncharacterised protein [Serratia liquefaciens]
MSITTELILEWMLLIEPIRRLPLLSLRWFCSLMMVLEINSAP